MTGKEVTKDHMFQQLSDYCKVNKEYTLSESNGKFLISKEDQPPITISIKNGKADSSDMEFLMKVVEFQAGIADTPAVIEADASKIMGLLAQVPGYTPEITLSMVANLVNCPEATPDAGAAARAAETPPITLRTSRLDNLGFFVGVAPSKSVFVLLPQQLARSLQERQAFE